jgi:cobaltochelatase CobN
LKSIKVAFATTHPGDTAPFVSALDLVNEKYGNLVTARLWCGGDFGDGNFKNIKTIDDFMRFAQNCDVAIVDFEQTRSELTKLINSLTYLNINLFLVSSDKTKTYHGLGKLEKNVLQNVFDYLNYGGKENFENLLLYLVNLFGGAQYKVIAPIAPQWEGIYHPEFGHILSLEEYLDKKVQPGNVTVGVWFYQGYLHEGNVSFIDDLIKEIEHQGANVLPVFFSGRANESLGTHGFDWVLETYFMQDGKPLVDVVISTLSNAWSTSCTCGSENLDALKKLGVPVIKTFLTFNTFEQWRDSTLGVGVNEVSWQAAMSEFDGFLITVPLAATAFSHADTATGTKIAKLEPIPERTSKLVSLSINWGKLRHIPNSEKKVAIIFHNYPPRNDNIGKAYGLDSAPSVLNILRGLQAQGYMCGALPETSQKLMETVLNGLTNDRRWLSSKELYQRALAKIPREQYVKWFGELPKDARGKMERDWGKPPGELFCYQNSLLIAGLSYGNVFIGLQPPRGHTDNIEAVYHTPDLSMPHHYYAYYRWIRDLFKANAIIHVGTHGTLEWLPGKSVGLSGSCFPDIAISDLPNIYPYIIDNPGEGTQAKRRSYCCIIDYLTPVMINADSYEDLAKLEVHLQEYYRTKRSGAGLLVLQELIWETVVQAKLDRDLGVTKENAFANFDVFLERLHGYLNELSDTLIRDGLHVLGEPPVGSGLEAFLVSMTRLSNGNIPSLRQSIAELKGYDYETLLLNRGLLRPDGRTNSDVINELNGLALELIKRFHSADFNAEYIDELMRAVLGSDHSNVRRCLMFISCSLVPALAATTDELTNTLSGCSGRYVLAGPSGGLTRGRADILPSGRNFYSIDPQCVPSAASWRVGVTLGDALLERYLKDEGKYPESIGIVVWATDCMRTSGDDTAEVLYLMGVKPVWAESSGRVVGLEVIPLEKLNHPRIDVTTRISGMFRDSFPNVVHVIDEAVALVASLKESPDKNYIVKHVENEVAKRVAQGVDPEKAREEACYRVFGDIPGGHGAGVSHAIDSKNWRDQHDLADIYVTWGCYAYGRRTWGRKVPDQFKQRLSSLNLTVKNDDTREYDILVCDDWYEVHGGMITAAKVLGGTAPRSYCGDNSDPGRVKVRSTAEETCHVFRSRLLNPKYIEGLKRHGYHGAAELSRVPDFVLGWDATVEAVEDWMWEGMANKYVLDPEMQKWLKEVNPYALQNITERLLEAIERGLWQASEDTKKKLQQLYLQVEGLLEDACEKK